MKQLRSPVEHFSFQLLTKDYLEHAVDLLVRCHLKAPNEMLGMTSIPSLLSGVVDSIETMLRQALKKDVRHGFKSRLANRLKEPTYNLTRESLVIIAIERRNITNIVGLVEIYPEEISYICNLAVCPTMRRQGLARALCLLCEQVAFQEWGRQEISLMVERSNVAAIRLYESLNYTAVSETNNIPCQEYLLGIRNLVTYSKKLGS